MAQKAQRMNSKTTLAQWADYWLRVYVKPNTKPGGYENYHDNMVKHILPRLGPLRLDQLTTAVLQDFLNREAEHGNLRDNGPLSSKSLRNMRVVLDVCCKRAVAEGCMDANPVPGTVIPHCRAKRVEIMTNDDQAQLELYLRDYGALSSLDAGISLGLHTGLRLGEVCALRWKHFNRREGSLHVEDTIRRISNYDPDAPYGSRTALVTTPVKSDASDRKLWLPDFLLDLLEARREQFVKTFCREPLEEDYIVFSDRGGVTDPDNLSHYFSDLLKVLRLPHVKYHALRHTFATIALQNGVDIKTVSSMLGHYSAGFTLDTYAHVTTAAQVEAANTMGSILQNAAEVIEQPAQVYAFG